MFFWLLFHSAHQICTDSLQITNHLWLMSQVIEQTNKFYLKTVSFVPICLWVYRNFSIFKVFCMQFDPFFFWKIYKFSRMGLVVEHNAIKPNTHIEIIEMFDRSPCIHTQIHQYICCFSHISSTLLLSSSCVHVNK